MPRPTSIEKSPPGMGWGLKEDPINHTFFKERIAAEQNERDELYSSIPSMVMAKGDETPMEKLARDHMPYDDGWDFDSIDTLLYGSVATVYQGQVGSCVGAGAASAVASKAASEILIEGDPENPYGTSTGINVPDRNHIVPFVGYHYGAGKSKDRYSNGKFNGGGSCSDGSYCSAQIWALMNTGVLPCSEVKSNYSGPFPQSDDVRSWGCNKRNELNEHLAIGLKYRMQNTTRVSSADDLMQVVTVLKQPCMICSGWGFAAQEQVDGLGWIYKHSGSWSHNVSIVAVVLYKGNWYVKVRNQWGQNAHKDGWHFWIPIEVFASWITSAECQSIGELTLKPAKISGFYF